MLSALFLLGCGHDPASLPMPDAGPLPEPDAMAPAPEPDSMPPPPPLATRFDPDAVLRSIPASGLAEGFSVPSEDYGVRYWATVDLDGSGQFDVSSFAPH